MADIVEFPPNKKTGPVDAPAGEADGPHLEGDAVCGSCRHEWRAVEPTGTTILECPKCSRMWGAFKHCVIPDVVWECNCGETLFWLTPTGAMCRRCGLRSNQWAE